MCGLSCSKIFHITFIGVDTEKIKKVEESEKSVILVKGETLVANFLRPWINTTRNSRPDQLLPVPTTGL